MSLVSQQVVGLKLQITRLHQSEIWFTEKVKTEIISSLNFFNYGFLIFLDILV